jgi:hypothetical protein
MVEIFEGTVPDLVRAVFVRIKEEKTLTQATSLLPMRQNGKFDGTVAKPSVVKELTTS